jgi:KUP system potassium uptake protein
VSITSITQTRLWREKLFALMSRNATPATTYFCLPPNRAIEMGSQTET